MEVQKKDNEKYLIECCKEEVHIINMLLFWNIIMNDKNEKEDILSQHIDCTVRNMASSMSRTIKDLQGDSVEADKRCLSCPAVHSNGPEACRMKKE